LETPIISNYLRLSGLEPFTLTPETESDWLMDEDIMANVRLHDSYTSDMGRNNTTGY
jgi:hypothetical protein